MNQNMTPKAFFAFQRHPFPPACPPSPLFRSPHIEAALRHAKGALQSRLHVLVTAEPGLGKTCFCRLLQEELNPRDFNCAYLVGQHIGPSDFLRGLAEAFGLETSPRRGRSAQLISAGLKKQAASSAPHPVLLLDEAQQLSFDAIELLRLITENEASTLLSLVLAGTDGLRRLLARPPLAALAGRLALRIHLLHMDVEQTAQFIHHAFSIVGMQNILAPSALAPLHAATAGSPREVAIMLSLAMQRAADQQSKLLTDVIVQEVIDGLQR
jgi:general secretion pathway protein A